MNIPHHGSQTLSNRMNSCTGICIAIAAPVLYAKICAHPIFYTYIYFYSHTSTHTHTHIHILCVWKGFVRFERVENWSVETERRRVMFRVTTALSSFYISRSFRFSNNLKPPPTPTTLVKLIRRSFRQMPHDTPFTRLRKLICIILLCKRQKFLPSRRAFETPIIFFCSGLNTHFF